MKRWITGFLSLLLAATLTACGGAELPPEPAEDTPGQTEGMDPVQEMEPQPSPAVPASAPVDPAWFRDAAFVGDSVSVMLDMYNTAYGSLGTPAFFCSVSLSQSNALTYPAGHERLPEYPKGSGQRPALLDGIQASGASKIYLMLGMNCIANGVDRACQDLVTLANGILERNPNAAILIQSVTPMTADSPRADASLNNETIAAFNDKVLAICQERGWYYINVAEALADENGYLRADYSGDKAMGIHLNYDGAAAWADYLLTHVPNALK